MKRERLLALAYVTARRFWIKSDEQLREEPENGRFKEREERYWKEMKEIENELERYEPEEKEQTRIEDAFNIKLEF